LRLFRSRIGALFLPDLALAPGQWRPLGESERKAALAISGR
jgi:16S rRNA U516 pseudouridylate synthase RsuA-like enzyme